MPHDFQSILSLMNMVIVACAGVAAVGFYQLFKALGWIPWEAIKPMKDKDLEIDMILSSMPKVTYNAYIPGQETENEISPSLPKVIGTGCIPERKMEDQSAEDPTF